MNLMIKKLVDEYVENINYRAMLSSKELSALTLRGVSRKTVKRDLFLSQMRQIAGLPHQDGRVTPTGRVSMSDTEEGFLRLVAPFVLPELAHDGAAFVVERRAVIEIAELEMDDRDVACVVDTWARRPSIYLDLPEGAVKLGNAWDVRAVFLARKSDRIKWSAVSVSNIHAGAVGISSWETSSVGSDDRFVAVVRESWNCSPEVRTTFCRAIIALTYRCISSASRQWIAAGPSDSESNLPLRVHEDEVTSYSLGNILGSGDFLFRIQSLRAGGGRLTPIASGTGRKRDKHIIVAGHWRQVACGKGRMERRWKWIEPFHHGPQDRPLETRPSLTRIRSRKRPREDV